MIEAIGHIVPFAEPVGHVGKALAVDQTQTLKQISTIRDLVEALVFQISSGMISPNGLKVQLQRLAELISHWGLGDRPEIGELISKLDQAISTYLQTELRLAPTLSKLEEVQAAFQLSPARISATIDMIMLHHTEMLAQAENGTLSMQVSTSSTVTSQPLATQDAVLKIAATAAAAAFQQRPPIDGFYAVMAVSGHRERTSTSTVDYII
jgi:hypothetical protein